MWTVTPAFLQAITQSHQIGYSCTVTVPGGAAVSLTLASGTVTVQADQDVRRTAQLLVAGDQSTYALLSTPGAVVRITHGVVYSATSSELVPLITGELSGAAQELGNGLISVSLADFGQRLSAASYLTAQNPAATAGRVSTAAAAVTDGVPGTTVANTASDTSAIGVAQTWPSSRTDLIRSLLTDAGAEGFFAPDGSYRIRDIPTTNGDPVWVLRPGDGGTVKSFTRNRPLDKLYNTVVVTPAALDGSQTWTQVVAQITDTANPRHPSYIGVRPYTWASPTIMTLAQAQAVAATLLNKVQGSTETLALGAISNPALDAGDVIRAVNPTTNGNEIITHLIDSLSVDILAGDMTIGTRAASE